MSFPAGFEKLVEDYQAERQRQAEIERLIQNSRIDKPGIQAQVGDWLISLGQKVKGSYPANSTTGSSDFDYVNFPR